MNSTVLYGTWLLWFVFNNHKNWFSKCQCTLQHTRTSKLTCIPPWCELISYCMHLFAHWKTLECLHTGMLNVLFAHCIMEYHSLHVFLLCEFLTSFVPRSSPALVFDRLQCAKPPKLTIWSHRKPGKKASPNNNCYIHCTPSLVVLTPSLVVLTPSLVILTPSFSRATCTLIEK